MRLKGLLNLRIAEIVCATGEEDLDRAIELLVGSRVLVLAIHAPKLGEILQMIQESWLLFQRGQLAEALRVLDEAKALLR